eukprot:CAMPEP_0115849554 /NCGR_PEP_ID=MMETSP0287-20121206/11510_1 /TAXON_ID=412157 /ORGANISM="Chrysochromulina rotalis, Strain UIO044" /LENGTH=414 /DNA_ID=CAMNT_0003303527 /DNA_START=30 /DNA_END=1275 /DNA_ORIENTATION=+
MERPVGQPNLDVRLTRSQSGSILDIDFVGVLGITPADMAASSGPSAAAVAAATASNSNNSSALVPVTNSASMAMVPSGRRLKILEHRVHKVEMRTKENGDVEEELVVSNLRPFTLKVGVHDHLDQPMIDCSLPLRATLLYENGLPVKQTSTSEPLLVGETDVVALQGAATFKLRITSLSSHRDKQRFRIQVAPQDVETQMSETCLCIVTDPMKSVTKLGRATGGPAGGAIPPLVPMPSDTAADVRQSEGLKRKYQETLESHAAQLQTLTETQSAIIRELQGLLALAHQRSMTEATRSPLVASRRAMAVPPRQAIETAVGYPRSRLLCPWRVTGGQWLPQAEVGGRAESEGVIRVDGEARALAVLPPAPQAGSHSLSLSRVELPTPGPGCSNACCVPLFPQGDVAACAATLRRSS